jgi:hypothetical protein
VVATVEADTPEEAIRRAGLQGVEVPFTPEMVPQRGDHLRLTWQALPQHLASR